MGCITPFVAIRHGVAKRVLFAMYSVVAVRSISYPPSTAVIRYITHVLRYQLRSGEYTGT